MELDSCVCIPAAKEAGKAGFWPFPWVGMGLKGREFSKLGEVFKWNMSSLLKNKINLIIILMLWGRSNREGGVIWELRHLTSYPSKKLHCCQISSSLPFHISPTNLLLNSRECLIPLSIPSALVQVLLCSHVDCWNSHLCGFPPLIWLLTLLYEWCLWNTSLIVSLHHFRGLMGSIAVLILSHCSQDKMQSPSLPDHAHLFSFISCHILHTPWCRQHTPTVHSELHRIHDDILCLRGFSFVPCAKSACPISTWWNPSLTDGQSERHLLLEAYKIPLKRVWGSFFLCTYSILHLGLQEPNLPCASGLIHGCSLSRSWVS